MSVQDAFVRLYFDVTMKQLLGYKRVYRSIILSAGIAAGLLLFIPSPASAACDPGQVTTDGGTCCAAGQEQIAGNGAITCPNQLPAGSCGTGTTTNTNVTNTQALQCLFQKYANPLVNLLSAMVGVVVVITVIRGAIEYTTSAGDPAKAAAGKKNITNALVGLAAYVMLYALLQFLIPGGIFNGS
jgi:hypothetical protein